jgi:hypothetical protein
VQITVRLTPEGFEAAERRLAELKQAARIQARDQLIALTERISARSTYASEEEAMADIEEAREAIWRESNLGPLSDPGDS